MTRARSAATAILWEIYAEHRVGFLVLLAGLAGGMLISFARATALGPHDLVADLLTLPGFLLTAFAFALFNFTRFDLKTQQAGFPTRLFTLPVATSTLVSIRMLTGVAAVTTLYLAWSTLVLRPLGRHFLIAWPAMVIAVGMILYQASLWSLAGLRTGRIVVLGAGGAALVTLAIFPAVMPRPGLTDGYGAWLTLAAVGVAAYVAAVVSVDRQRHAGGHGQGFCRVADRLAGLVPARTRPFRSAAGAQMWFELRHATVLPLVTLAILGIIWLISAVAGPISGKSVHLNLTVIAGIPLLLGGVIACGARMGQGSLPAVVALRPMSNGDLITARFRAAAVSAIAAWLILLAFIPMWLVTCCDTSALARTYRDYAGLIPGVPRPLFVTLVVVYLVLATWKSIVKATPLALSGRPALVAIVATLSTAAWITIAIAVANCDSDALARLLRRLFVLVPTVAWALNALFVAKVLAAAWLLRRSMGRGVMSRSQAIAWVSTWLIATAFAVTLFCATFYRDPFMRLPAPWLPALAGLVALHSFPIARLVLSPVAMAHSRHR